MSHQFAFTKPALHAIPPAAAGARAYYNDERMPGLQLIVTDRGTKTFYLYTWFRGGPKRFRIGPFPDVTPERARDLAAIMRGQVAENKDPTAERARERARGATLKDAFAEFVKVRRDLKPRTLRDYRRFLEGEFAAWYERPFAAITRDMVATRHAEISARGKKGKPAPAHANNAMRSLRAVLNFAMVHFEGPDGERPMPENPVGRLSETRAWNRVTRRTTVIAAHQLAPWFAAVLDLQAFPPNRPEAIVADYLMFLILTGVRRGEGARLKWEQVDLEARTFTLDDTKNRESHTLPLPDYLVSLLKRRKAIATGPYVFPGSTKGRDRPPSQQGEPQRRHSLPVGHLVEPKPQMKRIAAASGVPFMLHDLRRTFATVAESLDIPSYALKRLLNHKMRQDVTAGYLIITPERLREPMQRIADYFLKAAGIKKAGDDKGRKGKAKGKGRVRGAGARIEAGRAL